MKLFKSLLPVPIALWILIYSGSDRLTYLKIGSILLLISTALTVSVISINKRYSKTGETDFEDIRLMWKVFSWALEIGGAGWILLLPVSGSKEMFTVTNIVVYGIVSMLLVLTSSVRRFELRITDNNIEEYNENHVEEYEEEEETPIEFDDLEYLTDKDNETEFDKRIDEISERIKDKIKIPNFRGRDK